MVANAQSRRGAVGAPLCITVKPTPVGPVWVSFDRGSELCRPPTSASPQKLTSGPHEELVANGMDRPRSRPR
jgi:hypothetical protein